MTVVSAPCLPSLSDLFYLGREGFIGRLSLFFKVEFFPSFFSGRGQSSFPTPRGSSDPPGAGRRRMNENCKKLPLKSDKISIEWPELAVLRSEWWGSVRRLRNAIITEGLKRTVQWTLVILLPMLSTPFLLIKTRIYMGAHHFRG